MSALASTTALRTECRDDSSEIIKSHRLNFLRTNIRLRTSAVWTCVMLNSICAFLSAAVCRTKATSGEPAAGRPPMHPPTRTHYTALCGALRAL